MYDKIFIINGVYSLNEFTQKFKNVQELNQVIGNIKHATILFNNNPSVIHNNNNFANEGITKPEYF